MLRPPWTLWITGLSGAGKTTICKDLRKLFDEAGLKFEILRLDEVRQIITPNPTFSEREKELVYFSCAYIANLLNKHNINVILDSVDGKGEGRRVAKEMIANYGVIQIDCPLELCIEREKDRVDKAAIENLYERALMGQIRIAGVGYPYMREENPLIVIRSHEMDAADAAKEIFDKVVPVAARVTSD